MINRFTVLAVLFLCFLPGKPVNAYAQEIYLGMSADFSGPNRGLGIEFYRGAACYFESLNSRGGIHGRNVVIKAYDDRYEPEPAVNNTVKLVEEDQVFALFNYVGTPTPTRVLPLLRYYQEQGIYLFTPMTGADPVLGHEFVVGLRASYNEEIRVAVDRFVAAGATKIGVMHQLDAYGRGGWQGVKKALENHGLEIVAEATYERGQSLDSSFLPQVQILKEADPDAIISIATYEAGAAFIRDARDNGLDAVIHNLSFAGFFKMLKHLKAMENEYSRDYLSGLVSSQVVPFYGYEDHELVQEYLDCLELINPGLPDNIKVSGYDFPGPNSVGFEGFLNAMFIAAVLENLGPEIPRHQIPQVLDDAGGLNGPMHYRDIFFQWQDRDDVFFVSIRDGNIVSINDFSGLFK
ncbi:MAG: ABC transporter substrate-binding protein [Desulfonatronovibrio sp.]